MKVPVVIQVIGLVLEYGLALSNSELFIDYEDILSEDLMPTKLLMLGNLDDSIVNKNDSQTTSQTELMNEELNGSLVEAMKTMGYHRNMMNQYLCRNYLADEITSAIGFSSSSNFRMENSNDQERNSTFLRKMGSLDFNKLVADEGSSAYKDWLTKSTTLEDIYRHYSNAEERENINDETDDENNDTEETSTIKTNHRKEEVYYPADDLYSNSYTDNGNGYHYNKPVNKLKNGYLTGGYLVNDQNEPDHSNLYSFQHTSSPSKYYSQHDYGKEKNFSELFEIALTGLAYLSFAVFAVHVIMCISTITNTQSTMPSVTMPMSMSPTATTGGGMTSTGGGGNNSPTSTGGGTTTTSGGTTSTGSGTTSTGGGTTSTGGGTTSTGGGTTSTGGGGTTSTGTGSTGTGTTSTGGGTTSTGGGTTSTGGGSTGGGTTSTGGGTTSTGGGSTGGGTTSTGGGTTSTGGGSTGGGTTSTGSGTTSTGGGTTSTGGGSTSTGDDGTSTGGGTTSTGEGDTTSAGTDSTDDNDIDSGGNDGSDTGGTSTGSDTLKFKFRRDMPTITNPDVVVLNELARRILIAIESIAVASVDSGECLKRSLCQNNKWSRTLDGRSKIMVPLFSLGLSWISGQLIKSMSPAVSRFESLKAAVFGLGNAECAVIYSNCDLSKHKKILKRRRKRSSK